MSPLRLWRYVNLVFIKLIDCNECLSWYSLVFLGNLLSLMSSFSKSQQLSFETINSCKVHQSTIDEAYSLWFCHPRPSETLLIFAKRHLTKFWRVYIRRVFLTLFLCSFIAADRTLKNQLDHLGLIKISEKMFLFHTVLVFNTVLSVSIRMAKYSQWFYSGRSRLTSRILEV